MHPYLPHLLSDITAAHREEEALTESYKEAEEFDIEKHLEEVERWVRGEDESHTFGYYCGLQSINFPPPEQLENEDLKTVCDAFKKMMLTYNLSIDLPDNLPLPFAYSLIVDTLNTKTNIPKMGMITFDFCSGYAPECDLKSYCPCLKFWNEIDEDPSWDIDKSENSDRGISDEEELPF